MSESERLGVVSDTGIARSHGVPRCHAFGPASLQEAATPELDASSSGNNNGSNRKW